MHPTRQNLDLTLDALEAATPKLLADNGATEGADLFKALADEISLSAHPDDAHHVWSRLQCIQRDYGLIPGDDGDACDDGESKSPEPGTGGPV